MILSEPLDAGIRPFRWSTERFLALVESGVIAEGPGVELVDGMVVETMPQGEVHQFMFLALQRAFAAAGGFLRGLAVQPTIVLGEGNTYDPEFAVLRPEVAGKLPLPRGRDVLFVVEVSVTSLSYDLGVKKEGYAADGIPSYWVVDGVNRGIHAFSDPHDGIYRNERFFAVTESISIPAIGGVLDIGSIFPSAANSAEE